MRLANFARWVMRANTLTKVRALKSYTCTCAADSVVLIMKKRVSLLHMNNICTMFIHRWWSKWLLLWNLKRKCTIIVSGEVEPWNKQYVFHFSSFVQQSKGSSGKVRYSFKTSKVYDKIYIWPWIFLNRQNAANQF
jgi:hypothetical protein